MGPDYEVHGSLLTPGFAHEALPALLARLGLYPTDPGLLWCPLQQELEDAAAVGGQAHVLHQIVRPLARAMGYSQIKRAPSVYTREGLEDGGHTLRASSGSLRVWAVASETETDAVAPRGAAARSSATRRAIRVLRASQERAGFITNGKSLRLMLCDPAGPECQIVIPLSGSNGWIRQAAVPDTFRMAFGLVSPRGLSALPEVFNAARLHQASVTKVLRKQARAAIEGFLQGVIDLNPAVAASEFVSLLWRQALTVVYRLLFIFKLESSVQPGGGFGFAGLDLWRHGFSPNQALGPLVRRHLDLGHDTGRLLEDGLRVLFKVCHAGLEHFACSVPPLGGGLFDPAATARLDALPWGERSVALLLDRLLWTTPAGRERERVHYASLDVEELGRIYESLLDLEPGVATTPMIRMRRGRVEAVVPANLASIEHLDVIERIPSGCFFLRSSLNRRAGGAYYTPHEFVGFLVRETLGPLVRPLIDAANPAGILRLKVFDPAMGSGHFLVEACRFLAEALYDAFCRRQTAAADGQVHGVDNAADLDQQISAWLPERAFDRSDTGISRARALAICRRLVAVHCLYGVDYDPLAVELAKLSLWLESFAEGLPLTFLEHRLLVGDSIGGPFVSDLSRLPIGGAHLDPLLAAGVTDRLNERIRAAIPRVRELESSIGITLADLLAKDAANARLEEILSPLRALSRAWSGAVSGCARESNDAWLSLAVSVASTGALPPTLDSHQKDLLTAGDAALPLDLMFPEVFRSDRGKVGFDAVIGNPPWDVIHYQTKEFLALIDPRVMDAPTKRERLSIEQELLGQPSVREHFDTYKSTFIARKRLCDRLFPEVAGSGSIDLFQVFAARMLDCTTEGGAIGLVVPSSFHANEGTSKIRQRILDESNIELCLSFENRKKLFDIHGRQKFALIVARRPGPTVTFRCAFYLDSISQYLEPGRVMRYDRDFVAATGGAARTFLELRGETDLRIARKLFVDAPDMGQWMAAHRISFGREAHMTDDSHRFSPVSGKLFPDGLLLHEGKTFHQYTDQAKFSPRYGIAFDAIRDRPGWLRASRHYRLVFREISRSTDERTMIAAIMPPGYVFGHKATCEKAPWTRPDAVALMLCAIFNCFTFDWTIRRKIAASLSLFMVNSCPAPDLSVEAARFVTHAALRLSCRHAGYAGLWHAQLGPDVPFPLESPETLSTLRAAVDAVVADGYGIERDEFRHILTGFGHRLQPCAPRRCMSAFDALKASGPIEFYRKFDPFFAIALPDGPSYADSDTAMASATLIPSTAAESIPPAYPAPSPAG